MTDSLPSYLMGPFVVGKLAFRDVSERCGVYAEPEMIDRAEDEFSECLEKYLTAGESLFGPYRWERYDIVIMPKAFAYGGMENPRLTFLSPTLVVGDKSLTDTVAHEIAHSWFGNLVTNARWSQFYLNEGFTMYAQRRITDVVHGEAFTALEARVGWRLMRDAVRDATDPVFTRLHTPLPLNMDPDDAYNDVPYEKGYCLLMYLQTWMLTGEVGDERPEVKLDAWLRRYCEDFAFQSITSNDMIRHFHRFFPKLKGKLDWPYLLESEGLPFFKPDFSRSIELTDPADDLLRQFRGPPGNKRDDAVAKATFQSWSTYQKAYFLDKAIDYEDHVNGGPFCDDVLALASTLGLRTSTNREVTMRWCVLLLKHSLTDAFADVADHLRATGKLKFVLPVYRGLVRAQPRCLVDELATTIFHETKHTLDAQVAARVKAILDTPITTPPKEKKKKPRSPYDDISLPGASWAMLIRTPCVGCPKC
mmetsp:Transcript_13842/g.45150  ORF Transcript_13842/g.45150 Transcript_13842/m.45150 type:complete len:477 (+) Transcript_13842:606-2036(+)